MSPLPSYYLLYKDTFSRYVVLKKMIYNKESIRFVNVDAFKPYGSSGSPIVAAKTGEVIAIEQRSIFGNTLLSTYTDIIGFLRVNPVKQLRHFAMAEDDPNTMLGYGLPSELGFRQGRLEQFDGVAGRVLDYGLITANALDYLISKAGSCLTQHRYGVLEVFYFDREPVPSSMFLFGPIGHCLAATCF